MDVGAPGPLPPLPAGPLQLLQPLAEQLEASWITAALARRRQELEQLQEEQRAGGHWDGAMALRLAHLWLVAGVPGRGDDLVLEAHQLAPEAGLIPDWWGLWPQPAAEGEPERAGPMADLRQLAFSYVQLRHLPPLEAWQAWQEVVQAEPQRLDEPALRLLLGLVIHGRAQLAGGLGQELEQALAERVGEELVAAEPALAWRLFDPLCERLPAWGYARLKAADLSLQRGALERCRQHLEAATAEQQQLAWLHDIAARLALAEGDVVAALAAWQRAIRCCPADAVELFRQRAREARRGPGVLQARSLLNRGQQAEAIALLELLLEQDPQWQPLRSLLEQARPGGAGPGAAPPAAGLPQGPEADLERLERRLRLLAERAGLSWPPEPPQQAQQPEQDAAAAEQMVQRALARLALLS